MERTKAFLLVPVEPMNFSALGKSSSFLPGVLLLTLLGSRASVYSAQLLATPVLPQFPWYLLTEAFQVLWLIALPVGAWTLDHSSYLSNKVALSDTANC